MPKQGKNIKSGRVKKRKRTFTSGWAANVLKSLGYSSYDVIADLMPNTVEFGRQIKDAKDELDDALGIAKDKAKGLTSQAKTEFDKIKDKDLKDAIEDIKSGKFYNKDRAADAFGDFGDFGDFGFGDDGFDSFDTSDEDFDSFDVETNDPNTNVLVNANIDEENPMVQAQEVTSATVATGAEMISNANRENSVIISSAITKIGVGISDQLQLMNGEVAKISSTLPKTIAEQAALTTKFYEESLGYQKNISDTITELKTLYADSKKVVGGEKKDRYETKFGNLGSGINFGEYADIVKKNFKDAVSNNMYVSSIQSMMSLMKMQNELPDDKGLAAKGLNAIVKAIIPKGVKSATNKLDEFIKGMMLPIGMRIGEWQDDWSNPLKQTIGNIFGISAKPKLKADKSEYEKGAVAFDGKVHRAITDVIPTYLRMIASAVTGKEEVAFDYDKGIYRTVSAIKKDFDKNVKNSATTDFFSEKIDFSKFVDKLDGLSNAQSENIKNTFDEFLYNAVKSGEFVNFRKNDDGSDDIAKYTGLNTNDPTVQLIRQFFEGYIDAGRAADLNEIFSSKLMRSRDTAERKYHEMTSDALSHNYYVIDNGLDKPTSGSGSVSAKGVKSLAMDIYGRDQNSYLRDILGTLATGIKVVNVANIGGDPQGILNHSRRILDKLDLDVQEYNASQAGTPSSPRNVGVIQYDASQVSNALREVLAVEREEDGLDRLAGRLNNNNRFLREDNFIGRTIRRIHNARNSITQTADNAVNSISNRGIDLIYGRRSTPENNPNNSTNHDNTDRPESPTVSTSSSTPGNTNNTIDEDNTNDSSPSVSTNSINSTEQPPTIDNNQPSNYRNDPNGSTVIRYRNESPIATITENQIELANSASRAIHDIGRVGGNMTKQINSLNDALYGEDGLIVQIEEKQLGIGEKDESPIASKVKEDILNRAKRFVIGEQDENGNYKDGLLSDVANGAKSMKSEITKFSHDLIYGSEDGAQIGMIGYMRKFFGEDKDGKLNISGKVKEFGAEFKDHFKARAKEWTSMIFGEEEASVQEKFNTFMGDMKGKKGLIGAASAVGVLGSFFLPGGPIGGALLGAGAGIVSQSTQLKDFLFGKEDPNDDGKRKDGLIPEKFQSFFKDNKKRLTIGAGVGLLGSFFLPGGPVGGALIGGALSIATKSKTFSDMLYGENGDKEDPTGGIVGTINKFIKKNYSKDKNVSSTFLDAGIGAGAGLIGSFFLPGGPILGSLIGAGASIALNTDKFKDFFFGKEDPEDDGKRKGGVFGKYKDMIVEKAEEAQDKLSLWMEENITNPLKVSLDPIKEKIKKEAKQFLFGKEDEEGNKKGGLIGAIADRVDKSAFGDLKRAVKENIIDKMKDGFNKIFGGFFKLVGSIIKSPITALTAVAENLNKENNGEDAPSIADRIEELNRKSREKFQQKTSERNKSKSEQSDETTAATVGESDSYASSKKKVKIEKDMKLLASKLSSKKRRNNTSTTSGDTTDETTASSNNAEVVAEATNEVKDETAKVADNTEAIRDLTQTQVTESERSNGILDRIENTLSNVFGSVRNRLSRNNTDGQEDNSPQVSTNIANTNSGNKKPSKARGKSNNTENVSDVTTSDTTGDNTSPTASTSLTSLISGNPDDNVGKNIEKIAKSVDGQLNGTGYNLNRIYKLLKRRLGKGMGDDEDDEDIDDGKFKGTIGSRIWSVIKNPRKILEGITGAIGKAITGVKDFVIGGIKKTFGGILNAGKALLKLPKMLISGVKAAIPAIGKGIANTFKLGADLIANGLRAAGNFIEAGAKGFGNMIAGALTGFGELAHGLGILGKEALTLLAKGGAAAITGVAKAGAFIAKGAASAVSSLFKRRKKGNGSGTDNGAIATHVIIDGGRLDYIDNVAKIGKVDKIVSSGGSSSSDSDDNSARVMPFPGSNQPDTTTGEASPNSAAAALTGGLGSIKDSLKTFGQNAKAKGSSLIAKVKGSAENIRDKFKKEDSEEEQKTFRDKLLGLVQRNTEGTEQHHSVWNSIFSKKGLITAGLILMAPLIIKAVKGLINFFGSDLGKGLLESVKNLVGELGDRVSDEGGLVGVANNAGELATQVTDGIGLTKKESYVIDEETGAILTDENGNPITKTDSKAKGSLMNLFTPKKAKVDHETGEVYESREFDHTTETLGTGVEAIWKKKIVKPGKKFLRKYAKKNGIDKPSTTKEYASVAKQLYTNSKDKITSNVEKIKNFGNTIKNSKIGTKTVEVAKGLGDKVKNSKVVQNAIDVGKNSDIVKTASGFMKKAIDFIIDKFSALTKKFGTKGGGASKIASVIRKLTSKIFDADIIKQFMPKISKILGKVATAAGTLATSEVAWFALGALGGATNPGELFEVDMDSVEEGKTKLLMRAIAAVYKGIANTSVGSWFDLICDIVQEISGFNLAKVIATNVFNILSGEKGEEDLKQAQAKFDEGYTDYVQEEYEAYKKNQEDAGQQAMSFEEFQQSDLATSRADYNKEINPSLGKRVWDGVKKIGSGVGKVAKTVLKPFTVAKDTLFSHKETGWFEADGSYYVKSSASTKKAEFYNYYNVNGDLVDVVPAEEVDKKIKAGQLSQSEVKVKSNLSTNAEAFRVLSKRLWDEGTEKAKELWEKAKKKAKDTITKPFVEVKNTFFAHKDTGWFDTDGSYYVKASNIKVGKGYYNHYNVNGDLIGVSNASEIDEKINSGQLVESEVEVKSNLATNIDTIKLSAKTVWEKGTAKVKELWEKAKEKVGNISKQLKKVGNTFFSHKDTGWFDVDGSYYVKSSNSGTRVGEYYNHYNVNGDLIGVALADEVDEKINMGQLSQSEVKVKSDLATNIDTIRLSAKTVWEAGKNKIKGLWDKAKEKVNNLGKKISENPIAKYILPNRKTALATPEGNYYIKGSNGYDYYNSNGSMIAANIPEDVVTDMLESGQLVETEKWTSNETKRKVSELIHMGVTTISDVITLRKDTFNALKDTLTENTKYWTESIKEHGVLGAVMNFFVKKREVALYDVKGGYYVQNKDGTYNYFNINGDLVSENVPQEDVNDMMSQGLLTEGEIVEDSDAKEAISKIQSKVKTLWEEAKTKGIQAVDNLMGWLGLKEPETTKTSDSESAKASTTSAGKGDDKVETTSKSGTLNGFPYYSQNDPSIKDKPYNLSSGQSDTMGDRGCGPTAMSMIASQLTGRDIDPTTMANMATIGGYSIDEGTTPEYFGNAAASLGITSESAVPSKENIKAMLGSGKPIILQGQDTREGSPFTGEGHYVVGVGINGDNVVVNDPRGRKYSKEYSIDSILGGAQNMWGFSNNGISSDGSIISGFGGYGTGVAGDTLNGFPYLLQGDDRWGSTMYSSVNDKSQTIASSACGPTSMAMVLRSYGNNVTPIDTSQYALQNGFRTANSGTSWGFFPSIGSKYGLTTHSLGKDASGAIDELEKGNPVIASMGPNTFTKGGHYIVLSGLTEDGRVLVNDPGKVSRSNVSYDPSVFAKEGKNFWSFSKDGKGSINNVTETDGIDMKSLVSVANSASTAITEGTPDAGTMTGQKVDTADSSVADTKTGGINIDVDGLTSVANKATTAISTGEVQESSDDSSTSITDLILGGIEAFTTPIINWMKGDSGNKTITDDESENATVSTTTASTSNGSMNYATDTSTNSASASNKLDSFGNIANLSNSAISVANANNSMSSSGLTSSFANVANVMNDAARIATDGDYLGKYTEQFESGGRGPATISTGTGDKGGVSFGTYQFATYNQPQVDSNSPLATFWNTYYGSKHPGVVPGNNEAFKQAWVQEANADPTTFKAREAAFFGNSYYRTQANNLSDIVDVDSYDRGFQEQVFATSIHYGANTGVLRNALSGKNVESMNPKDVINTVEDYKASTVDNYFSKCSDNVKKGLLNRFNNTERNQMLQLANKPTVKPISDSLKTENNGSPIAGKGGDDVIKIGSSGTMDRATNVSKAVEQQNTMTALDNSLLSKMVELLGYIVNNTSNMDGGIKELCGKDFGSSQTNVIGGTTHNNIIPVPQQTESNSKSETNQQYSTAKMISAGLYLT